MRKQYKVILFLFGLLLFSAVLFASFLSGERVLLTTDALKFSKHYVKEMPRSYIEANALTYFLEMDLRYQRVALRNQQGIYNLWLKYLLSFNTIATFNYADMPRMAGDYKSFLAAGQRDPLNMWRFSSVKHLLGSTNAEHQLIAANCQKVFAFNLSQAKDGGYGIVPVMDGPFAVYELMDTLPRFALFAGSLKGSDESALNNISDFSRVIFPLDSSLPELASSGQCGQVEVLAYRPSRVQHKVHADVPSIPRCADRYDADWEASIDGETVKMGRVDSLYQGVAVPVGEHVVEFWYAPSRFFFYMQCTGYLILFGALATMFLRRKDGHVAN